MPVDLSAEFKELLSRTTLNLAFLWKVERKDGVTFYFTDHDCTLPYDGNNYLPAGGTSASARQASGSLQQTNMELTGILDSDYITEADLQAGRYRGATITELAVFWDRPDRGPILTRIYNLDSVSYTGEIWVGSLSGFAALFQRAIGGTYTRTCPYEVGDADCRATVPVSTGTVSTIIDPRRKFSTSGLTFQDGWYEWGKLTWTSGANNGLGADVRTWAGGVLELQLNTFADIQTGDTFTVTVGCDGRLTTCHARFGNQDNFGGFPTVPGSDRMYSIARSGS